MKVRNNENTLLIQDLYSNTTKANLLKNDRASKENEKKESYKYELIRDELVISNRSLKIDLASLADKENEQG